ncbi:nuclear transport factor 2 family protein [Flindersiella endophytica]
MGPTEVSGDVVDSAAVAEAFNAAINARDLDRLAGLMTDDHTFVDSAGETVAGKPACVDAWRGFFEAFPDYRNVFTSLVADAADGAVVTIEGRSECADARLAGPARWTAVVRDGRVARWQVDDA